MIVIKVKIIITIFPRFIF